MGKKWGRQVENNAKMGLFIKEKKRGRFNPVSDQCPDEI